jgi:RimJ/RimL family protein N-acetyltransferase
VIRGEKIGLRARCDDDIPILREELYNDVAMRSRADGRPWRPFPEGSGKAPYTGDPPDNTDFFSVVELSSGELAGEAELWGIDRHNRKAHLGLSLRPSCRGRGYGTDIVRALCEYGFAVRGLQRLQIETLTDNAPMVATALATGFTREGTLRRAAWVYGAFADEAIFGLLVEEWRARGQTGDGVGSPAP